MSRTRTTRFLELGAHTKEAEVHSMCDLLRSLNGVGRVEPESAGRLRLHYDLAKTRMRRIENHLWAAGYTLSNGLLKRWKRGWTEFMESNEFDNLSASSGPCCSNPKGIVSKSETK
jgi:hypothetical protein